ncbi:hypothetical protein GFC29_1694 [Anoxybacillus sp. B7M1]|jgi:competence protein ComGE|uniref:competence type IV pilus minor pilin ComGE n=1 Tax=unclassified Anoxybacillus TaxID=2639704 RepID=UPI0005CD4457|nr:MULTISPECIES: competence type IV pilus minor pilin ComGE [unclassified Anoxybacillus]ANB55501.1 hypothetical protein GFC28_3739 [Anoxybacillus sp. B2M1]ANB62914.1 hypothetical protein GFC29_1694 [Anoxybacillus sp. B7M1]
MHKSCKGFTLVETVIALSLLLFVTTILLPAITQVMMERQNQALKSHAQQLLNKEMGNQEPVIEKAVVVEGVEYKVLRSHNENGVMKICIQWHDYMGRKAERCGYYKNSETKPRLYDY